MAFSICYWANYTQGKTKLSRKSEIAVADDRVLKFLYNADLRHVESSVQAECVLSCYGKLPFFTTSVIKKPLCVIVCGNSANFLKLQHGLFRVGIRNATGI